MQNSLYKHVPTIMCSACQWTAQNWKQSILNLLHFKKRVIFNLVVCIWCCKKIKIKNKKLEHKDMMKYVWWWYNVCYVGLSIGKDLTIAYISRYLGHDTIMSRYPEFAIFLIFNFLVLNVILVFKSDVIYWVCRPTIKIKKCWKLHSKQRDLKRSQ